MLRTAIFQLRDDQYAVLVVVGLQCQNKEIQLVSNHTTAASGSGVRGREGATLSKSRRRGLSPTKFGSWDAARASACTYARAISRDKRRFRGQSLGLQVGRANKSQRLSSVVSTMEPKNACLHHIDRFFAIDRAERRPKRWHACI